MVLCEQISVVSNLFSMLSLCSWICAQLPQIYANYTSKSAEGISPHFLLLWFMGDFLSFTSCLLNDVVLKFQVYLSLFFICNDLTLCYQYYYYNSVYPKKHMRIPQLDPAEPEQYGYSESSDTNPYITRSIQIHKHDTTPGEANKDNPISGYLSSSGSPDGSYNSTASNFPTKKNSRGAQALAIGAAAAMNLSSANAFPTSGEVAVAEAAGFFSKDTLGFVLAWSCTCVYVASRCPQLYKNYKRKSVDGISPLLFGSALLGNLTYTLSIVTSCSFLFSDKRSSFIIKELPYILGSSGTILFDVAYFYQRYLYRFNGRETNVMELEEENWYEERL